VKRNRNKKRQELRRGRHAQCHAYNDAVQRDAEFQNVGGDLTVGVDMVMVVVVIVCMLIVVVIVVIMMVGMLVVFGVVMQMCKQSMLNVTASIRVDIRCCSQST
jgi:hypothetical protein